MKKLVLFAVAVVAISFVSCGNTQKPVEEAAQDVATQVEAAPAVVDSVANVIDSVATQVAK